jgi:hypothetical protein
MSPEDVEKCQEDTELNSLVRFQQRVPNLKVDTL